MKELGRRLAHGDSIGGPASALEAAANVVAQVTRRSDVPRRSRLCAEDVVSSRACRFVSGDGDLCNRLWIYFVATRQAPKYPSAMPRELKIGRNEPCPCGGGREYKRCHYQPGGSVSVGDDGSLGVSIPMNDDMRAILLEQRRKFVERFGRQPGPNDRIFFDAPSKEELDDALLEAMTTVQAPPEMIYAYRKSGRLVTSENRKFVPAAALQAWDDTIAEYFELIGQQQKEPL